MKTILTHNEVLALLLKACNLHGTVAVARRLGIETAYLINIQRGRKGIGPKIFSAMGMEPVYRLTHEGKALWS